MQISPTAPQFDYIHHKAPYPALVAGFGSGKTEAAVLRSIIGKLKYPDLDRGFYAPTYDLIRMIAFPRFEAILEQLEIPYRLYKSPLNYIEIHGKGKIFFRSMDAPHRIIGYEHADADVDELDTMKPDDAAYAWRQILARNRQLKPNKEVNTIGCTTTPEGFKFVYETWKNNPAKGYEIIQAPTRSNPHLPDGYIDSLKSMYPENLLAAYLEGEFVNLTSGTVYNGYNRETCRSNEEIKEKEPLMVGMDFNVTNMSAVVYVKREKAWHGVSELAGIYDTPAMINALKEKFPEHNTRVYPDASGKSRKTVDASISDISLLESAGFIVYANSKNPFVKDRIAAANNAFEKGLLFINDKNCPEYARCMEQLAYDKNGVPDKTSNLDHLPDAGTYPIAYEMPINKPVANVEISFAR